MSSQPSSGYERKYNAKQINRHNRVNECNCQVQFNELELFPI